MLLHQLAHQVAPRDLDFFILGIAGDANDLHAVEQGLRHPQGIRRGHEHDVRKIVVDFQIVVVEGAVLFRVENFEQGRRPLGDAARSELSHPRYSRGCE